MMKKGVAHPDYGRRRLSLRMDVNWWSRQQQQQQQQPLGLAVVWCCCMMLSTSQRIAE